MSRNRDGEQGHFPQRQERFFQRNEYWYYATREGADMGPFDSYEEAVLGADEFIDFIESASPTFNEILKRYAA